jgi:hypothetical protein
MTQHTAAIVNKLRKPLFEHAGTAAPRLAQGETVKTMYAAADTIDALVKALEKIRDEAWTPGDLEIRDCKEPEMIWQSVARRALAVVSEQQASEAK